MSVATCEGFDTRDLKEAKVVEKDLPYIFTDLEFEPMIEARFAAIKQGFDYSMS